MLCPNCGAELLENAKFCTKCGAAVQVTDEIAQQAQPQPVETPASSDTSAQQPQIYQQPAMQVSTPPQKKSKTGLIIALVAVAAVLVIGVVGFFAIGILAGPKTSPVFVEDSYTSVNTNGYSSVTTLNHDEKGNLMSISGSGDDLDDATIEHDSNGYIVNITVKGKKYATVTNTLDTSGRIKSSRFEFASGPTMNTTYEYHGNTLNVKSITNSSDNTIKASQALALNQLGIVRNHALDTFIDGSGTVTTEFDDTGRPISITDAEGKRDLKVTPKSERAGKTKKDGNTETSYDENGNIIKITVTSSDSAHSSYTYTHSYHEVKDPSTASYILNHLY